MRKTASFVLASMLVIGVPLISPELDAAYADNCTLTGQGTLEAPYEISSESDLIGYQNCDAPGVFSVLQNDIELTLDWSPYPLAGYFDGNNNRISGLVVNPDELNPGGLFSEINHGAVYALEIYQPLVAGEASGALAGEIYASLIQGVTVKEPLIWGLVGGGLVGTDFGGSTIVETQVLGANVSAIYSGGGLVGSVSIDEGVGDSVYSKTYANGTVTGEFSQTQSDLGGLIGDAGVGAGESLLIEQSGFEGFIKSQSNPARDSGNPAVGGAIGTVWGVGGVGIVDSFTIPTIQLDDYSITPAAFVANLEDSPTVETRHSWTSPTVTHLEDLERGPQTDFRVGVGTLTGVVVDDERLVGVANFTEGAAFEADSIEMRDNNTFDDEGWSVEMDSNNNHSTQQTWILQDDIGNGYPFLKWMYDAGWQQLEDYGGCELNGSGTADDPYTLSRLTDLQEVGVGDCDDATVEVHYKLTSDIAVWGGNWDPVALSSSVDPTVWFDGNGHTIQDINVVQNFPGNAGLFTVIESAKIKDLTLRAGDMTCAVGGCFAGVLSGVIEDSIIERVTVLPSGMVGTPEDAPSPVDSSAAGALAGGIAESQLSYIFAYQLDSPDVSRIYAEYAGGIAGYAVLTEFDNIDVDVNLAAEYAGGLAGAGSYEGEFAFSQLQVAVDSGYGNTALAGLFGELDQVFEESTTIRVEDLVLVGSAVVSASQEESPQGFLVGDTYGNVNLEVSRVAISLDLVSSFGATAELQTRLVGGSLQSLTVNNVFISDFVVDTLDSGNGTIADFSSESALEALNAYQIGDEYELVDPIEDSLVTSFIMDTAYVYPTNIWNTFMVPRSVFGYTNTETGGVLTLSVPSYNPIDRPTGWYVEISVNGTVVQEHSLLFADLFSWSSTGLEFRLPDLDAGSELEIMTIVTTEVYGAEYPLGMQSAQFTKAAPCPAGSSSDNGYEPCRSDAPAPAAPFSGPVLDPVSGETLSAGNEVALTGKTLSGTTAVFVAGVEAEIKSVSATEIVIKLPVELAAGLSDVELLGSYGRVVVQDHIIVSGEAPEVDSDKPHASVKRIGDTVRIFMIELVGIGKVQFFLNGREIAWVRAVDESDPKLRQHPSGVYLVRTKDLVEGKNVIEVYLEGERIRRVAYTK